MITKLKLYILFFILAFILNPLILEAAETDREELFKQTELMFIGEELYTVSIASRKAEPLRRAPGAVTVISSAELKKYRTLAEALRRVPGFFIDRNELKERIFLRGIPDSFLVMMDGVPFLNDASTIDYPRGLDLSLDYIDKIEIIRGPGSSLWGPDAFSGIINLVTKKGADIKGFEINAETGSHNMRGISGMSGFSHKGWDGSLFGSYRTEKGFEKDLGGNQRRRYDFFTELYGRLSYKDFLEISGRFSKYRDFYTVPSFLFQGSEHKPVSFLQTSLNKSFEKTSLSLQAWVQYYDGLDDYQDTRFRQKNWQYALEGKIDHELFNNNVATVGGSFRYNNGSRTKMFYEEERYDYFPKYDNKLYSFYFQDKWMLFRDIEATFGIRYDDHSQYNDFVSPRAGISYGFLDFFNIKLLYGRAFRTPSLSVIMEKPGLKPEKIDSYEAEIGFTYKNIFSAELNYFYNELENIIERDALGEITNKAKDNIKGLEFNFTFRPHRSVSFYGTYTHLLGNRQKGARTLYEDDTDPDKPVTDTIDGFQNVAPDNVITLGVDYRFLKYFRLNLEAGYADKRKIASGSTFLYDEKTELSSYFLLDLNFFIKDLPVKNMEMHLKLKNLADRSYHTRGVFGRVDGAPRAAYFKLKYRF